MILCKHKFRLLAPKGYTLVCTKCGKTTSR
jgi:hypothetical protein